MTIVKSPNVRIMMGVEMSFSIGRTIVLSKPKINPAIKYSLIPPPKLNPATNQAAAYKATELPKILNIKTII